MNRLLVILLLLSSISANARKFVVKQLGMDKGLSSNYILSIAQDKRGYMWFATEEGLNRFDGLQFYTYYKNGTKGKGLTGNELNCLLDDPKQPILWIGTQRDGINAYNYADNSFTYYRHDKKNPHSLITNDITNIRPAADGNIWITTFWKGIDYYNKKTGQFIHYNTQNVKGLPSDQVWCVLDMGYGMIYAGHVSNGFSIINTRTRRAQNFCHNPLSPQSLSGNEVHCIYRDRIGNIWIGTDKGLDLFNPARNEFIHYDDHGLLKQKIFDIHELSDDRLWVATEFGGIAILDISHYFVSSENSCKVEYINNGPDDDNINGTSVRCLFEDQYNNVWIGMYGEGINFLTYHLPPFSLINYSPLNLPSHLTNKTVMSVCLDKRGNLWAGTDGDGVNVFDRNKKRIRHIDHEVGRFMQTSFCDSKGKLWFGGFNSGGYVYTADGQLLKPIFPAGTNIDVRYFYENNDGTISIGTSTGIFVADINTYKVLAHYKVSNNQVRTIAKDKNGRIWIGTFGNGLGVFTSHYRRIKEFTTSNGFTSNTVNQIIRDNRGRMWVATAEGLVCFPSVNGWKYTVYGWNSNLNNINIRSVIEDDKGNIWVGTNKGISCLLHGTRRFNNYIYKDNLPLGNFNAASVTKGADGILYFGSNEGLCYFNPSLLLKRRISPPTQITKILVTNPHSETDSTITFFVGDGVTLSHRQNTFSVSFNVKNYALTGEVEYSYRLKGLQSDWTITPDNVITFRNIPPGNYQLLVRSRFRNQEWSSQITSFDINILPPLWQTWWAKVFYVICLLIIAWMLLRNYKHRIHLQYLYDSERKEREQEKYLNNERLQFYTNITHELRTPLTLIIGPLQDLINDSNIADDLHRRIEMIHKSANRLNDLISKILEFRKTETDNRKLSVGRANVVAILREITTKHIELNTKQNVKMHFNAREEIINMYFDKEILNIIIDNLVTNAIKYTDKGRIDIDVERVRKDNIDYAQITVSDTGHGISPEALPHIFERYYQEHGPHQASGTGIGLSLVKSLVTLHEGTIDVESQPDKGSRFTVRFRIDNNYHDADRMPDSKDEEAEDAKEETTNVMIQKEGSQKPILLIVEDNEDICQYIADSFKDEFEIETAENGKIGLKKAFQIIPDIIISDIMMPYMDGNQMCKTLKHDIRTSHIPIILLTAKDSMESKEEGYDSGADSYITKPFVRSLIASRIHNLLEQRQRLTNTFSSESRIDSYIEDKKELLLSSLNALDQEFLEKINKLIEERMSNDKIDIDYLADNLNISESTLYRKMKALTGLSSNEYIRKYKMKYAEHLLLEGKYTISEIGYKVGMGTTAYFRKCFKEEFGDTPSDYLRKIKN